MNPASNWIVVREVISSTEDGASVMGSLPALVRRLIDEKAWREFTAPNPFGVVRHESFGEFVRDSPPKGLGGRVDQMLALCGTNEELAKEVRRLLYADLPDAAPAVHAGPGRGNKTERTTLGFSGPRSETVERTVRRLKRDDPELAEKVVSGEVSAYSAARAKGWKPPRIQVTNPDRIADSLSRYLPREALARLVERLVELLTKEDD